jgi:hypothetical protein
MVDACDVIIQVFVNSHFNLGWWCSWIALQLSGVASYVVSLVSDYRDQVNQVEVGGHSTLLFLSGPLRWIVTNQLFGG